MCIKTHKGSTLLCSVAAGTGLDRNRGHPARCAPIVSGGLHYNAAGGVFGAAGACWYCIHRQSTWPALGLDAVLLNGRRARYLLPRSRASGHVTKTRLLCARAPRAVTSRHNGGHCYRGRSLAPLPFPGRVLI